MRFSMLYSGEQILSFKSCLVFYAEDSLRYFIRNNVRVGIYTGRLGVYLFGDLKI